jgi:type I restriction enzyme, R subunit
MPSRRLNTVIPSDAREEAVRKVLRHDAPSLVTNNRAFHRMVRDGVPVEYRRDDGSIAGDHVRLIDFDYPDANDWLAVNQFTVIDLTARGTQAGGQNNLPVRGTQTGRRPDIVVFVNGLPLGIIELKIPEDTDKWFAAVRCRDIACASC